VDTPTREELIASSNSPEEICKFLGADSLGYISLPNLKRAVADTRDDYCTSCYTGVYPTDLVQLEVREGSHNGKLSGTTSDSSTEDLAAQRPVAVEHEN
jgi:glutamine phosphoribosylpyrophosphate amidotransferase